MGYSNDVGKKRKKNGRRRDSLKQPKQERGLIAMAHRGKQVSRKTPYL